MKRSAPFRIWVGKIWLVGVFFLILGSGCGKKGPTGPSFEELIDEGWQAFGSKDYAQAAEKFTQAKAQNPTRVEAYVGMGWSLFKLDRLDEANTAFNDGSKQPEPTADLYAGWAFTLNALKLYSLSNVKADLALAADSAWTFTRGLPLNFKHLLILKAANYYLLGKFDRALEAVQKVNPQFQADIRTSEGLVALAQEIERLQSTGGA